MAKRPLEEGALVAVDAKRHKGALVVAQEERPRISSLAAECLKLRGHEGDVMAVKFSPDGQLIASGASDKRILLWEASGRCKNVACLRGHSNAILDLKWSSDGTAIFSVGADKTLQYWDVESRTRTRKLNKAHDMIVNACCPTRSGPPLVVTGGDDCNVRVWDVRGPKRPIFNLAADTPITGVAIGEDRDSIYAGGVSGVISVWELRKQEVSYTLTGHSGIVTDVQISPDGNFLLSNAMDNTVRQWDIRPYSPGNRELKRFVGHAHGVDKNLLRCAWSPNQAFVAAGSADSPPILNVWDAETREFGARLRGHESSVNDVHFHPTEPLLVSCSTDRTVIVGELPILQQTI